MSKDRPEIVVRKRKKERRLPVPQDGFTLRRQGNLTLVLPDKKRGLWRPAELPFRSLVFNNQSGEVLSLGLPKFFTAEQDPGTAAEADQALRERTATAAIKYDGMLVIRSVIRGRVVFRTRQSFDGEHLAERIEELAGERYPVLKDESFEPQASLLFEYVSPKHRIVIPYDFEDLILIGRAEHKTLVQSSWKELEGLADAHHLRLAEEIECADSLEEFRSQVESREGIEGAVLRFDGGQRLLKVKRRGYEEATLLRYRYHPRKLYDICRTKKVTDAADLVKRAGLGAEDPLAGYVKEVHQTYVKLEADLDRSLDELQELVDQNTGLSRKRFSAEVAQPLGLPLSVAAIALRGGDDAEARRLLEAHWAKARFQDPTAP